MPVITRGQLTNKRLAALWDFKTASSCVELTLHMNDRTPYTRVSSQELYDSAYYRYNVADTTAAQRVQLAKFLHPEDYKMLMDSKLPREIYYIYHSWECFGLSSTFYHLKWRNWKFLSILQILDVIQHYKKKGQNDLVDIAYWSEPTCYYIFKLCYIQSCQKFVVLQDLRDYRDPEKIFSSATYTFTADTAPKESLFDFYEAFARGGIFNTEKPYPLSNAIFHYRYNLLKDDEMMTNRRY